MKPGSESSPQLYEDMFFALAVAAKAGELAMAHYKRGIKVEIKDDKTPVTRADKECERLIREAIELRYPNDSILGEEEGESEPESKGKSARKWIVDPIDGTYNYARYIPYFSTLLALEIDGEVVLGVVHSPACGETYHAAKGLGAFRNQIPIRVSQQNELSRTHLVFGEPARILKQGFWTGFTNLVAATERHRGFGDYLAFALVFDGRAEATIEVGVKPWDLAPMKIIAEEAGGRYSDLDGGNSIYKGHCLVSNGKVHDDCMAILTGKK